MLPVLLLASGTKSTCQTRGARARRRTGYESTPKRELGGENEVEVTPGVLIRAVGEHIIPIILNGSSC